jgi:nucleotide-binding universal stress UspA family protein
MKVGKQFTVLFASDSSAVAEVAVGFGAGFPWPSDAVGHGIVAKQIPRESRQSVLQTACDQTAVATASTLSRTLARRWPKGSVHIVENEPVAAILGEATRMRADAIVVGWRGHGPVRRLLAGSVSRGVTRGAGCAVLVVHRSRPAVRRVVVGFDGSDNSRRAVEFVARLEAPEGGSVLLLSAVQHLRVPMTGVLPSIAAQVAAEVRRTNKEKVEAAQRELTLAAQSLAASRWQVSTRITKGVALREILAAVVEADADLLVVGARGTTGLEHLLVGSVAEGALDRSPVPVLVVR